MPKIKTIDLFAGVGGISRGFEQASNASLDVQFETVFANDIEPSCEATYNLNSKSAKLTIQDLKTIAPNQIPSLIFCWIDIANYNFFYKCLTCTKITKL